MAGKRNSYDETRLASSMAQSEAASVSKTASLPRNARMVLESQPPPTGRTTTETKGRVVSLSLFTSVMSADAGVTVTTTEAMPTQSVPTETSFPRGGEGAKVERELSRGESVESLRSDRSFTEESETK